MKNIWCRSALWGNFSYYTVHFLARVHPQVVSKVTGKSRAKTCQQPVTLLVCRMVCRSRTLALHSSVLHAHVSSARLASAHFLQSCGVLYIELLCRTRADSTCVPVYVQCISKPLGRHHSNAEVAIFTGELHLQSAVVFILWNLKTCFKVLCSSLPEDGINVS